MPLVILDAHPSGQAVFNTDDIVKITMVFGSPEVVLRNMDEPILLPHGSVSEVAAAIDDFENHVLKGASATL